MFGSLKKKLSSAIQEGIIISESLQQQVRQRVSTPTTPVTPTFDDSKSSRNSLSSAELGIPSDLNMAAGCNVLSKYEEDWKNIHSANQENAKKAAEVAEQIEQINQRVTEQKLIMSDFHGCLAGIPSLIIKIKESMQTIENLSKLTHQIENDIEILQDLCEECDLQEFILDKECELYQFTQKKMGELEKYRRKVAAEHEEKMQKYEENLRKIQRERQAVFDDAFRNDLEEYKQRGSIPKIEKNLSQGLSLEEVTLEDEDTKDALEEFLNG